MITLDFETRSAADLIKWGATRYAFDETSQALCMCWAYDEEEEVHLWHRGHEWIDEAEFPEELCDRIASGEMVEAHNAGFEFAIWNYCLRREFKLFRPFKIKLEQLRCSAAKASCLSLPRSLGDAVDALGLPHKKLADGRRLINKLSKPIPVRGAGKSASGLPFKTIVKRIICNGYEPDQVLTYGYSDNVADYVLENYPEAAAAIKSKTTARSSARDVLHRLRDIDGVVEGNSPFRWIEEPERFEIDDPTPDKTLGKREVVFCEEEIEHRRNWAYCADDVRAERGLSGALPEMTPRELEYWAMDFRMNQRGILLDLEGAKAALELAKLEGERLNGELQEITGDPDMRGSKRKAYQAWANAKLQEIGEDPLPNTKADTLSFKLYGVPTKAGDEARAAIKPQMDERWEALGEEGARIKRTMEICMEVNRSSVSKYRQMVDSVCPDGALHDIMLYNGADRTGRWSGKGVQPHNFVRGYKADMMMAWEDIVAMDREQITLVWEEPMVALAKACRGALRSRPGKVLYAADFNAIEARKLAWLSGCGSMLEKFKPGQDIYLDMAEAIYKRPLNKKENPNERNLGKKAILGLGYAMGWEKFQLTVWNDEGIWLEDEFCQEVVRLYRKDKYPEVPRLWKDTGNAAILAVTEGGERYAGGDEFGIGSISYFMSDDRRFLHCRLPSGRLLAYFMPEVHTRVTYRFAALNAQGKPTQVSFPAKKNVPQHRVRWHAEKLAEKQMKRLLPDPPENFLSPHLSFMGRDLYTKKWIRVGTHGGSLVENYDQASSRDLLAEAMFRIDSLDIFDLLLSIHDEVISEGAKEACTLKEFEDLMAVVPKWAPGMPITAEGWIGERLRK